MINYIRHKPLSLLLTTLPLALMAEVFHWGAVWVFTLSALAVIPLAAYIGEGTEALAAYTNPRVGGLLNATLGNAAELIITVVAIRAGLLELVKASITGSILGNVLLVMGFSMVVGGLRNGVQTFDRRQASRNAILLVLAVIALIIPSLFSGYINNPQSIRVEALSVGTAIVMMILYGLSLLYSLKFEDTPVSRKPTEEIIHTTSWSIRSAAIILVLATIGVVIASELLVEAVEPVMVGLGISEFFIGIILIPLIGNVAEHFVAVQVAARNQMNLSVEIAVSSSLQIALFVAPVLVFISLLFGNPLQLIFNDLELIALIAGVIIMAFVSEDGESNWLEGAVLLTIYLILALGFFLID
ncbi:MAG: calcium/proton exchanger [Anaerolineales bacterium]|jgi:Ca2+:H+ antiporter